MASNDVGIEVYQGEKTAMAQQVANTDAAADASGTSQWPPALGKRVIEALAPLNGKLIDGAATIGNGLVASGRKHLERDVEVSLRLSRCTRADQIAAVQRDWLEAVNEQHRTDGLWLMQTAGTLATTVLSAPMQLFGSISRTRTE